MGPVPLTLSALLGPFVLSTIVAYGCARLRGWSPRNHWLAVLLGMHLGPVGWVAILLAPARRN